ncbi:hypothetical protein EMCRGX_G024933 [Ephydatia muelleri]
MQWPGLNGAAFVNEVLNPHSLNRYISDPPHLIKTTRNCWSRNKLWCNGKDISWNRLKDLYLVDNDINTAAPRLRLVPKLTEVLSATIAKAIRTTRGFEVEETVKLIENFDKFFDCLNIEMASDFTDYIEQRNKSVKSRVGYSDKQKKSMLLSPETRLGVKISDFIGRADKILVHFT